MMDYSALGPRQAEKASRAFRDLRSESFKVDKVCGGVKMTLAYIGLATDSPVKNPEAARIFNEMLRKWDGTPITPKNLKAFLAECEAAQTKAAAARLTEDPS